ncbi:4Fe-4S ferredoxin, partial [Sulfolobus sp. F1]
DTNYLPPSDITKPRFVVKGPEGVKDLKINTLHEKKEENYLGLLAFTIGSEFALGYTVFKLPFWSFIGFLVPLLTLLLSVNHARRYDRFYRVIYNLKTSWLSREVLFSSLSVLFYLLSILNTLFYYPAVVFLALGVLSSIMIYMVKARPSWYNSETPISFVGTVFTTTLPLAYYFTHSYYYLIPLMLILIIEIISTYITKREIKIRGSLNVFSLVLSLLSFIIPAIIVIVEILNIVSEVVNRREFYQKVIYYGLPKV